MNSQEMMEEIDRLARLCEAKDAENKTIAENAAHIALNQSNYIGELQAQIAIQHDALKTIHDLIWNRETEKLSHKDAMDVIKITMKALTATSETVAAWRAKETEPLLREVAMLREQLRLALGLIPNWADVLKSNIGTALHNTQATVIAYEREVTERARIDTLKEIKERISSDTASAFDWIYKELRASNKGE